MEKTAELAPLFKLQKGGPIRLYRTVSGVPRFRRHHTAPPVFLLFPAMDTRQGSNRECELQKSPGLRLAETFASIPQPTHLEVACLLVILDQVVLIQHQGSSVNQIQSALVQQGVSLEVIVRDAIEGWGPEHSDVQIGIAQPVHRVLRNSAWCQHTELVSK